MGVTSEAEGRAYETAARITNLLSEYGIRVPEDIECEVYELIEAQYQDIEELAWQYGEVSK